MVDTFVVPASDPRLGRAVCYPVCGMMHIKEPMLIIGKSKYMSGSLSYV